MKTDILQDNKQIRVVIFCNGRVVNKYTDYFEVTSSCFINYG